jgi:hypothetical protein
VITLTGMNVVCSGAIALARAPHLLHSRDQRGIKGAARSAENALRRLPDLSQIIDNVGSAGAAAQLIFCAFPVRERQTELGQDKIEGGYARQSPRATGRRLASEKRLRTVRPMIFIAENSAQSAHVATRRGRDADFGRDPLQCSGELILTDPGRQLAEYRSFFIPV